ncbi:permease [Bacillus sp. CGMCC 1.16541]|uniref:permease n=1 Tax=Bacillus sp. CGMCC 1.16541 TaxID=2185143 RepID=UPI000D7369ED|nr:permease [Bacillus sp. CGMCC 1.16541]
MYLVTKEVKRVTLSKISKEVVGLLLLLLFGYCFFFLDMSKIELEVPSSFLNVNAIFLSIVLEALPFILLGVFASAIIQTFVSEELLQRFIPKNAYAALLPAAIVSVIIPVCECAIIPVVRRLIKKGMPLHVGVVILVGAPILNPIVLMSTYYAFQTNLSIVYGRMGLAFLLCMVIGLVVYVVFKNKNQLKSVHEHHHEVTGNKLKQTLYHASDEFFDMGKYLIIGAFVASLFQTFLDRQLLVQIASSEIVAPAVMMAFAYVLSLCSEADAFVASSFAHTFNASSLLAFLVYGPMIDLKNTIMMMAFFKKRFVIGFIVIVTVFVYGAILVYQAVI